jgi:hypothetical protein
MIDAQPENGDLVELAGSCLTAAMGPGCVKTFWFFGFLASVGRCDGFFGFSPVAAPARGFGHQFADLTTVGVDWGVNGRRREPMPP